MREENDQEGGEKQMSKILNGFDQKKGARKMKRFMLLGSLLGLVAFLVLSASSAYAADVTAKVRVATYAGADTLIVCAYGSSLLYTGGVMTVVSSGNSYPVSGFYYSYTDGTSAPLWGGGSHATEADVTVTDVYAGTVGHTGFEIYGFRGPGTGTKIINIRLSGLLQRGGGTETIGLGSGPSSYNYRYSLTDGATGAPCVSYTGYNIDQSSYCFTGYGVVGTAGSTFPLSGAISASSSVYRKIYMMLYVPVGTVVGTYTKANAYVITLE